MNTFYKPKVGILIAPNKCASSYSRKVIPQSNVCTKKDVTNNHEEKLFCLVRDPVEWYISGWRYAASHLLEQSKSENYTLTWDEHLEFCYECVQNWDGKQPDQFGHHCWLNPIAQGTKYTGRIDQVVQIENKKRLWKILKLFDAVPIDEKVNEYTKENVARRRPGKNYYDKPILTKKSIKFLHKLATWSNEAGYNLDTCIKKYINTI